MTAHAPGQPVDVALYFDASCRARPDKGFEVQGGWFAVVFGASRLFAGGIVGPHKKKLCSSTAAEWEALYAGLSWVKDFKSIKRLVIWGDAQSVIDAINERNRSGSDGRAGHCLDLLQKMQVKFIAKWGPRGENGLADQLSRGTQADLAALAAKITPPVTLPETPPAVGCPEARDRLTRVLAEHLWQLAGCPHGDDLRFWLEA